GIGAMWLVPRSADDLGKRRAIHRFWAEGSYGLMGRTPDHVACVLTAFAGWRQLFDRAGQRFGDNVVRFYERARDDDVYVASAIVRPQLDRATPAHTTANFQALVRFGVKLELIAGLVAKLVEMQGSGSDANTQATLGGEIAAHCAAFDALVKAAERFPLISEGYARPHPQYIYAGMSLQRRIIVDIY